MASASTKPFVSGWRRFTKALISGFSCARMLIGVRVSPGSTALTRIPDSAYLEAV